MIYTDEELKELVDIMSEINQSAFLPESQLNYIWNNYKRINNTNERQPCSCSSAAGLWKKATTSINEYLSSLESKTD